MGKETEKLSDRIRAAIATEFNKPHELKIVVMARQSLTGHISLAVFQGIICLGAWGSYPKVLKTEPKSSFYLFSKAAAKTITSAQHKSLEQYIKRYKKGKHSWTLGVNDCTDWVLNTLRFMNINAPSDKLLPMKLMEAFLKHSDWEQFYVPFIAPDSWNRC